MNSRAPSTTLPLLAAGCLGFTGVALGAMGAHALKAPLMERGMMQAWETAARYHLFHAVGILAIAAWVRASTDGSSVRRLIGACHCWIIGTVLFSGSLYWLALGGPRWLGPITPIGGVAFMIGWVLVALSAWTRRA